PMLNILSSTCRVSAHFFCYLRVGRLLLRPFFFFLVIRRPPGSTLFPTRRSSDLRSPVSVIASATASSALFSCRSAPRKPRICTRSEEHTSELQSRENLVCRLLLEKKKTSHTTIPQKSKKYKRP